jgi:glucosylceramidase
MHERHLPSIPVVLIASVLGCTRAPSGMASQGTLAAPVLPVTSASAGGVDRAREPTLILTTQVTPFVRSGVSAATTGAQSDVTVDSDKTFQIISGFGGAFNEHGWEALSTLSPTERDDVLKALFDPVNGLRFNMARSPIGASDYAVDRYTLDETAGDTQMVKFSIERDKQRLIPFIKAALKIRPDLKLWSSAWTPPTWMKSNKAFDGGAFKDEPQIYAAYALYLTKFVESYRQEGINVFMVVPQNEPAQLTHYPSCDWKPAQYVKFIRDYLGPAFRSKKVDTAIFVGTINRHDWDVMTVLKDAPTLAYVSGVAVQWDGLQQLGKIHGAFPQLAIMQSETECGNNHWQPGYNRERAPNDFRYAAYTWRKFRDFIAAGSSSYFVWNMVLDEQGKNIDSVSPWPQNSAVVVDRSARRAIYTPMYWATKHYSGLVDVGARLVHTDGAYKDKIAFVNPDGTAVVELLNGERAPTRVTVAIGSRSFAVELPAESFATLVVPKP